MLGRQAIFFALYIRLLRLCFLWIVEYSGIRGEKRIERGGYCPGLFRSEAAHENRRAWVGRIWLGEKDCMHGLCAPSASRFRFFSRMINDLIFLSGAVSGPCLKGFLGLKGQMKLFLVSYNLQDMSYKNRLPPAHQLFALASGPRMP